MKFIATPLSGAYLLERDAREDERGFFARTFCSDEFREHGLDPALVQCSVSFNRARGTLRGLHYQLAPHEEVKTVYCLSGAVWDVIVDLRPDSPTRFQWFAAELRALSGRGLYMPRGFAHGFLTLEPDSTVEYFIAPRYVPEASAGIRWNDERLSIAWPFKPAVISERDLSLPVVDGDG